LFASFEQILTDQESNQADVFDPDTILGTITELLEGKIGNPPKDQDSIDAIIKDGEKRYSEKTPPGYLDAKKASDQTSEYTYGGIVYQREYGDFIIWKQLLAESKDRNLEYVVFLTDDKKDDWWWMINGKHLGPRPELRDEIHRLAGVKLFHLYNSEQFLNVSSEYLDVEVSEESVRAAGDLLEYSSSLGTQESVEDSINNALDTLSPRERRVIQLRFGLDDERTRTLEQVGREFSLTRERIRQIQVRAFRKLRHPSRSRHLVKFLEIPKPEIDPNYLLLLYGIFGEPIEEVEVNDDY